jgi:hypothetical protein
VFRGKLFGDLFYVVGEEEADPEDEYRPTARELS